MITTEKIALHQNKQISRTTIHGWKSIIFGVPFIIAGTAIILMCLDILIHVPDSSIKVPRNLAATFGGIFLLPGIYLVTHGILGVKRLSRLTKTSSAYWNLDYNWNPQYSFDRNFKELTSCYYSAIFFLLFLIPFNIFAFYILEGKQIFFRTIIVIFNIFFLLNLGHCIYLLIKFIKFGRSKLIFNQFPYFVGNKFQATVQTSRRLENIELLDTTLRCIEENYEIYGTETDKRSKVVTYQIYAENKKLEVTDIDANFGNLSFNIDFDIPNNNYYKTQLAKRPAIYWELEINAFRPGLDYKSNFIVPIY